MSSNKKCSHCGDSFTPNNIAKHEKSCKNKKTGLHVLAEAAEKCALPGANGKRLQFSPRSRKSRVRKSIRKSRSRKTVRKSRK